MHIDAVKNAMLAVQRYPWEQGVCAQALWELGDETTAIAMAHDSVLRQREDGRLAVINENIAVTDPAANGEVVWRAYERTGDEKYRSGAEKMLDYLLHKALRTENGCICHNEVSFHEGYSPNQIWVDSVYMAPPFLAVMGEIDEAMAQIEGYLSYLKDDVTGLLYHIYDAGTKRFVRKKLWATGNGWALLGIARVVETALERGKKAHADKLIGYGKTLLDAMLKYQLTDGRFHDILDEPDSFVEGTAAMMTAAFIYRGVAGGWLSGEYLKHADIVRETMEQYVDEFGLIREVCGCPHFQSPGTSAESMAAYLMMWAWYEKVASEERGTFLSEKIKELNRVTSEIEAVFPEKSFKLDGILIGNIVEVLTAQAYGITLYKQSEKTHDGEVNGKKVQIKGTQGKDAIVIRDEPEYLLVEYLDKETGTIQEIYNGPGSLAWQYRSYVPSMNFYTIRINKLLELAAGISEEERIMPVVPIKKYAKCVITSKKATTEHKQGKRKIGKTLVEGYVNRNNQENRGCLNKPGNHANQLAYLLHCNVCGFEYEANGCDVAIRKCPRCQ